MLIISEELPDGRTGNISLKHIENFEADTLKYAIKECTKKDVMLTTDSYSSYKSLQQEMDLTLVKSQKGSGLEELHKQIMLFKNWLRGIHYKCSKEHLHAYLKEYVYRFNRRNKRQYLFNEMIEKMMNNIPHPYNYLITKCGCYT